MLDETEAHGWVLKALREASNSLVSELYGLDDQQLRRRIGDDDWSLKEIAAHLRDAEELALAQLTAIAEGKAGPLPAWDVDLLPLERDYQSADLNEALSQFSQFRRETTYLLWGLADDDWELGGDHPHRGRVIVGQIAKELAQHDLEHLWQVRRIKHQLGARARIPEED